MKNSTLLLTAALVASAAYAAPQFPGGQRVLAGAELAAVSSGQGIGINVSPRFNPSMALAPESRDDSKTIITEAPQGTVRNYEFTGYNFTYGWVGLLYTTSTYVSETVWCDNGDVYIKDVIFAASFDSYVKGKYADGKITVSLPQYVSRQEYWGVSDYLYVGLFNLTETDDGPEMVDVEGTSEVTFSVSDDFSTITLDLNPGYEPSGSELPPQIIGLGIEGEGWQGYGSGSLTGTLFDDNITELPEGVETQPWNLLSTYDNLVLNVATVGDTFYIGGINLKGVDLPGYIVGKVQGDQVVFESGQYLGSYYGYSVYFTAMNLDDNYVVEVFDNLKFDYDAEKQMMTCVSKYDCMVFSAEKDNPRMYIDYYQGVTLSCQNTELTNASPVAPEINGFSELNPAYGIGNIYFSIPAVNVNGQILDTNRMYYHFLVDDEVYGLDPEEYYGLSEYMEDIPYNFTDYNDIEVYGEEHNLWFYVAAAESYGIQSFYLGTDGVAYASAPAVISLDTVGITDVEDVSVPVQVVFTDMLGRRVANPDGMVIKTERFADGTVKSSKVVLRK